MGSKNAVAHIMYIPHLKTRCGVRADTEIDIRSWPLVGRIRVQCGLHLTEKGLQVSKHHAVVDDDAAVTQARAPDVETVHADGELTCDIQALRTCEPLDAPAHAVTHSGHAVHKA